MTMRNFSYIGLMKIAQSTAPAPAVTNAAPAKPVEPVIDTEKIRRTASDLKKALSDINKEWHSLGSFNQWEQRGKYIGPKAVVDFANRVLSPEQIAEWKGPPLRRNGVDLTQDEMDKIRSTAARYVASKRGTGVPGRLVAGKPGSSSAGIVR